MTAKRVLIIGDTGQVANHLKHQLPQATAWGRGHIDWTRSQNAIDQIVEFAPTHLINAVAYTALDQAEDEPELAWQVNVDAPKQMAIAARHLDIPFIHLSTDYVFDGTCLNEYPDSASVSPCNVYGASKYAGEVAVALHCEKHWIVRASWVFSQYGNNFVKTMLKLYADRPEVSVVADQFGRPTYAGDIARLCASLVNLEEVPWGTYHFSGGRSCSWHQFAQAISKSAVDLGLITKPPRIEPIQTDQYPTKARRPLHNILQGSKELERIDGGLGDWQNGLLETLQDLSA